MAALRRVDPTRPPGRATRLLSRLSTTKPGRWLSRRVAWRLDPVLLRLTRGRVSSTVVVPAAVLETRGARTGATRRNAVIYFHDGERVVISASNAGSARHPDWFHNLVAHPDVAFGGVPMRAEVVGDEAERERLWSLADRVFPGFSTFRAEAERSGRSIPLVVLRGV